MEAENTGSNNQPTPCPECGHELTMHRWQSGEKLGGIELRESDAHFFSCTQCGKFWNRCRTHGFFCADTSLGRLGCGTVCPACEWKRLARGIVLSVIVNRGPGVRDAAV